MFQEAGSQEQLTRCAPRFAVTCFEATERTLFIGTVKGLWFLRELDAPATQLAGEELVTSVIATGQRVYFSTWMGGGLYAVSQTTLGVERLGYPDTVSYDRSLIRMHATALWNNTIAVATDAGLFSYAIGRSRWSEPHSEESFQFLLATGTRLWAFCAGEIVGFDRQYRVVERAAARVAARPVQEQSRIWWADTAPTGVRLWSFTPTSRSPRSIDFRLDETAARRGRIESPTVLARWGAFWYVGTGIPSLDSPYHPRSGQLLRLNFTRRRAELVWNGASVSALAVWRGNLMVGTRDGLYILQRMR